MTPDEALAEVRRRMNGRTRYEGQEPRADEVLAEEVERLRAALREHKEVVEDACAKMLGHRLRAEKLEAAFKFYADPETYYGIGFLADSPCGEFAQDFSDDHGDGTLPGPRPGARARRALGEESGRG